MRYAIRKAIPRAARSRRKFIGGVAPEEDVVGEAAVDLPPHRDARLDLGLVERPGVCGDLVAERDSCLTGDQVAEFV